MNSYASPTPVDRRWLSLRSLWRLLDSLFGYNKTLQLIWERRDFECDHFRGPASSPILYDGKLFVAFDGIDLQYVVAMDAKTGKTVWQ